MQYKPCNSALLAQEKLFLTQKGTIFAQNTKNGTNLSTGQFFFVFDPYRQLWRQKSNLVWFFYHIFSKIFEEK